MGIAWTVAVPLAVIGLVALLTDWIDWAWWIAVALILPAGVLPFLALDRLHDLLDSLDDGGDLTSGGDAGGGDGGG